MARIAQTEALKFYHGNLPGAPSNLQEIVKLFPGWTLEEADNNWNAAFVYHCLCKAGFELPPLAIDGSDWTTWVLNDLRLTYIKGSDPSFLPLRGDIVLYEDGAAGIVMAASEAGITTAEGNVNNLSAVLQRPLDEYVRGMIRITNGS